MAGGWWTVDGGRRTVNGSWERGRRFQSGALAGNPLDMAVCFL